MALNNARIGFTCRGQAEDGTYLASEAIQGSALTLERIDHVEGSDCLAATVLGVCDSVTDDVLQEHLEDTCARGVI